MSTAATNICPRCTALVVITPAEVKNLLTLPWVKTSEDLAAVIENVLCDDCSEWSDADVWHRTEDTEHALQKQTLEALDDLI